MRQDRPVVVVVDDSPYVLELYEAILEGIADVRTFESVPRALHGIHEADMVLTDLMMPQVSGLALIDYLAGRHPDIPVLLVTGCDRGSPDLDEAIRRGIPILRKPFSLNDLRWVVTATLGLAPPVPA